MIEAVQGLDEPYRAVVVHRFFDALTVAEIAALGGDPEDTVRTRIRRALARLRERLDETHGGDRRAWTAGTCVGVFFRPARARLVICITTRISRRTRRIG